MTVIKDCTGVYLRSKSGQDSYVCNDAILDAYATGTEIRVQFDAIDECYGLLEPPACSDDHTFVEKIDVLEIYD